MRPTILELLRPVYRAMKVMHALEKMGEKQFVPSIGPVKGRIVEDIIKKHKPRRILEIGALHGYSAILMATVLPEVGRVTTIEIDEANAITVRRNVKEAGLSNKVEVIVGNALEVLPSLNGKFDLLFIDASKNEYFKYLKLAEKNLKKGSVVVADNVGIFQEEMQDYLDYVRNSGRYRSDTIKTLLEFSKDVPDAIEVSIKL